MIEWAQTMSVPWKIVEWNKRERIRNPRREGLYFPLHGERLTTFQVEGSFLREANSSRSPNFLLAKKDFVSWTENAHKKWSSSFPSTKKRKYTCARYYFQNHLLASSQSGSDNVRERLAPILSDIKSAEILSENWCPNLSSSQQFVAYKGADRAKTPGKSAGVYWHRIRQTVPERTHAWRLRVVSLPSEFALVALCLLHGWFFILLDPGRIGAPVRLCTRVRCTNIFHRSHGVYRRFSARTHTRARVARHSLSIIIPHRYFESLRACLCGVYRSRIDVLNVYIMIQMMSLLPMPMYLKRLPFSAMCSLPLDS